MRGTLYIVSASSGTGKSSIVNATLERDQQIALSISFTSRQPRPNERHAQHYYFVSADEFQRMIEAGDFLNTHWSMAIGKAPPANRWSHNWLPVTMYC